jgi:delta 1-pyrroline-5-carboxylate dehydrogenase
MLRIEATVARIAARRPHGNVHGTVCVNRNMIGAVVGAQPFGGSGLSGTGSKAGGRAICTPAALRNFCPRFGLNAGATVFATAMARRHVLSVTGTALSCLDDRRRVRRTRKMARLTRVNLIGTRIRYSPPHD